MKKLFLFLIMTSVVFMGFSQDEDQTNVKIKISIDSLDKVDTVIHIKSDSDHDEIQKLIAEISMLKDEKGSIISNIRKGSGDSIFDIDVSVDLKGINTYIDSVISETFENMDFHFEYNEEMDEVIKKNMKKHYIIEREDGECEQGEHVIIIKDDDGKHEKIIIKSDDNKYMYKYHKDFDLEKEREDVVK